MQTPQVYLRLEFQTGQSLLRRCPRPPIVYYPIETALCRIMQGSLETKVSAEMFFKGRAALCLV